MMSRPERQSVSTGSVIEIPFYPVLIFAYLPLLLLAPNLAVFDIQHGIRAALVMAMLGIVLFGFANALVKNRHYAALLSILPIATISALMLNPGYGLPCFFMAVVLIFFLWRRRLGRQATRIMNLFALAIFVQPLTTISLDYAAVQNSQKINWETSPFHTSSFSASDKSPAPNIVHILLDGYAGAMSLQEEHDFDNTPFLNALESRGFILGSDVHTPYNQTLLVTAAVFNGAYLDPSQYPLTETKPDRMRMALGNTVHEGPFSQRLAELGYSFLSAGSGYYFFRPANEEILSEPNLGFFSLNGFEDFLTGRILAAFPDELSALLDTDRSQAEKNNAYLRHAISSDDYRQQKSPFHYFVHLLAPHPPFVIDRNGDTTDRWLKDFGTLRDASDVTLMNPTRQANYREGYLEKLRYVNNALLPQIDAYIAEIPSPKVIILHGDHGSGASFNHDDKASGCLTDRYTPLLAIYSDEPTITEAFSSIATDRFNLVNIYRVLADASFGTSMAQLEDKSWFASWNDPHNLVLLDETEIHASCSTSASANFAQQSHASHEPQ